MAAANFVDDAGAAVAGLPARYRLQASLGAGAQARTFAVVDAHDGAERVLKLFGAGAAGQGSALAEFRSLETLIHPSVVRVRDIGRTQDGHLFVVTDKVIGPTLDRLTAIPDEEARREAFARASVDLATALALLHARGIVHGDVTPGNVRLSEGPDGGPPGAVLIDFGLAGAAVPGGAGGARGTLGYAAPEALTGARTPATDLFGLGATLYEAWCGAAPFGRGLAAARRTLAGPPPVLSSIRPGLGAGWDRLLERLLAADPGDRPASARVVLRELTRLRGDAHAGDADLEVPHPDGDPLAGLFVGRRAERALVRRSLESLLDGAPPQAVLALVGAPGSGRRTLFEAAARDVAVTGVAQALPAIEVWRGDFAGFERWMDAGDAGPEDDPRRALEHRLARLARALEARAAARPLCVYLDESEAAGAFARFVGGAAPVAPALVVVAVREPLDAPYAVSIDLAPLSAEDVGALIEAGLDEAAPEGAAAALATASAGNAAVAAALARRLIAGVRAGTTLPVSLTAGEDLDAVLAQGVAALSGEARRLLLAVALVERDAPGVAGLDDRWAAAAGAEARRAGWLSAADGGVRSLPSSAHRRAVLAAVAGDADREVGARALAAGELSPERKADALQVAGRPAEAADVLRAQAGAASVDPPEAAALLGRALRLGPIALTFRERVVQATGLGALGRYEQAAEALAAARDLASSPARSPRRACSHARRSGGRARRAGTGAGRRRSGRSGGADAARAAGPAAGHGRAAPRGPGGGRAVAGRRTAAGRRRPVGGRGGAARRRLPGRAGERRRAARGVARASRRDPPSLSGRSPRAAGRRDPRRP